jgi:hypothetical protein
MQFPRENLDCGIHPQNRAFRLSFHAQTLSINYSYSKKKRNQQQILFHKSSIKKIGTASIINPKLRVSIALRGGVIDRLFPFYPHKI